MRKLLSLLLAVLMIVSCVPAAMFIGASAEETGTPEAPELSYKDPRETATKIYYAPLVGVTAAMLADDEYYASSTKISSSSYLYSALTNGTAGKTTYEAGSVLVIPFIGSTPMNFATNTSLNRSEYLAFTAPTLFRADGTKLPIVIEGVVNGGVVPTITLDDSAYGSMSFANDYYFSNLTIKRTSEKTTSTVQDLYAGSGNVVFHNVTFDFASNVNVTFAGDSYNVDPFCNWTEARFNANKGADGLLSAGFTFGKNTSVNSRTVLAAASSNGHSGTTVYKANYPKVADALTETNISTALTRAAEMRYTNGKLLSNANNSVVQPTDTSTYITIDNGQAASTTPEFTKVYTRKGCMPVAKAEVKLVSGNVQYMYGDAYSNENSYNGQSTTTGKVENVDYWKNREIYVGDTTITIDGGNVIECVYGLFYSHLIGNYTINLNGGVVKRINGTEQTAKNSSIRGNYLFHATGGEIGSYYGGCAVTGEGNTVKTVIDGGTFKTVFNCLRFAVTSIVNEINGGTFDGAFRGGSNGNYSGSSITNVITGGTFNSDFYTGGTNASATLGTVTTNISGGSFKYIGKGSATATSNTINVISTKATDVIKLSGASVTTPRTYTFDKFEMNGGMVNFWAVNVTANNAKGDVVVRNTGDWLDENTYFTFTPAEGATLNVTPTQATGITTRGTVNVVDGKYLVQKEGQAIELVGAKLVLTERIAVKFVFTGASIDSVGKENVQLTAVLNGENLLEGAELKEEGDTYTLTTKGIGLPDANTAFKLSGDFLADAEFSIAGLAETAATQWTGEWKDWAVALQNMIDVVIDGQENTITPADKDYDDYTANANRDIITSATASMVMNSAVGAEVKLSFNGLPANPVVKVNDKVIEGVYTTEGDVATIAIYFAPQFMEENFTLQLLDGRNVLFTLDASVACLAKALNSDAGNALLAYVQATTAAAAK